MAVNLFTPIVNTRTRSVNFFNGRLLSGEDLTTEHQSNRAARALLGKAIGSGVVSGFEVSESTTSSTVQAPVLAVTKGLALNRNGGSLLLDMDVEIALTRPTTSTTASSTLFKACAPIQTGAYVAGAGAYLLTVGPASASEGLAQVNGISTATAPCNTDYKAHGVQFRLVQIDLSQADIADSAHLQNTLAYRCFGIANWDQFRTDPFNGAPSDYGLIDQMRSAQLITNCEVPLALLYWTATSGVVFVDMWSVRRRVTRGDESDAWPLFVNDRVLSDAEAMVLQFQDQIAGLFENNASPQSVDSASVFRYLPPAGILPAAAGTVRGFDYLQFFASNIVRKPVFVEGARLEMILRTALLYPPIDLTSQELIWLYLVRENRQPLGQQSVSSAQPYLVFVKGDAPNYGDAHYQVAHWNYSNYL
jgi:hypothetical protein